MAAHNLFDLSNKIIVVTGGAGHLGKSISEGLAEANAIVFIAGNNLEKCQMVAEEINLKFNLKTTQALELDINSSNSINACFKNITQKHGKIDVLINNACFGKGGTIEDISEENWTDGINGTINGVFKCIQAVIPHMNRNKGGSIINIASIYGVVSPDPNIYGDSGFNNPPNYGAGKAAIIQFTKYAACHLGTKKIRVNAISPGAFPDEDVQKNKNFITHLNKKIPLGRIGRSDELKGITIFLSSDASSYITGANIMVDGGWTAW
ncbi:SDR family oxidoreductase [Candidatus Woesearchaeota archaeon]|nr:SDR family oxidoreductase [Candidatus Woesearchaeota archaeon]